MLRRNFTKAVVASPLAIAACTSTTVNGVTTITLNLVSFENYALAAENGINLLLDVPAIAAALGTKAAIAAAAAKDIATSLAALATADAGQTSISFNKNSPPLAIASIMSDLSTTFGNVQIVATSLGTSLSANVTEIYDAFSTVVSLATALYSGTVGAPVTPMPAAQALKLLGVSA